MRATLKLARPVTELEVDLNENSIEANGYLIIPKGKTNADRIRAMSDEELAEWLILTVCKYRSCGNCPMSDWCSPGRGIADWLKSPAEADNG